MVVPAWLEVAVHMQGRDGPLRRGKGWLAAVVPQATRLKRIEREFVIKDDISAHRGDARAAYAASLYNTGFIKLGVETPFTTPAFVLPCHCDARGLGHG